MSIHANPRAFGDTSIQMRLKYILVRRLLDGQHSAACIQFQPTETPSINIFQWSRNSWTFYPTLRRKTATNIPNYTRKKGQWSNQNIVTQLNQALSYVHVQLVRWRHQYTPANYPLFDFLFFPMILYRYCGRLYNKDNPHKTQTVPVSRLVGLITFRSCIGIGRTINPWGSYSVPVHCAAQCTSMFTGQIPSLLLILINLLIYNLFLFYWNLNVNYINMWTTIAIRHHFLCTAISICIL